MPAISDTTESRSPRMSAGPQSLISCLRIPGELGITFLAVCHMITIMF